MRKIICFLVILAFLMPIYLIDSYADENKWEDLIVESDKVLGEMAEMPERGIPKSLLRGCKGIAIFPSTIRGGFIIGAEYGQGVLLCKEDGKWTAPAVFNMGGGSFGWQIGGQAVDVILLIMNDRGIDGLVKGKCKLGADASVSAGPYGRDAEAAADIQLKSGILAYARSRGLFIGLKVEGSIITQNSEANRVLYGGDFSAKDILLKRKVKPTPAGEELIKSLVKYSK